MASWLTLWLTMLGTNLLLVGFLIAMGAWQAKHPPAYRPDSLRQFGWGWNLSGYRSAMSKKNADTWEFANRNIGRRALRTGLIGLPVVVLAMLPLLGRSENVVGVGGTVLMAVVCVGIFVPMVQTERSLRATFTRDGARRDRSGRRPTTGTRASQSRGTGRDPRSPRRGTR